ncbi:TetR/AcrR family transcriptional regulator [Streptomyces sp. NPDC090306]|uniref:TetR/AcrR family transcriptional regulator n=1 Tax=Streptomyces sp. NPDC090306 TaxID=3365961 RepID=UPI0037F66014
MNGNEATPVTGAVEDRRRRRSRMTRQALAQAAVELILEHGLAAVGVDAIADRADVTRRTFSRHFSGKEDAALDFTRADGDRINAALRERPADEPLLVSYRAAVRSWLTDAERPAWHGRPEPRALLALVDEEPALFAAYERIKADAQAESVRILAERLGTDPAKDPRPGIVVEAGAGALSTVLRLWARGADGGPEDLAAKVDRAFDVLLEEAVLGSRRGTHPPAPGNP